jgi:hypothetical protein
MQRGPLIGTIRVIFVLVADRALHPRRLRSLAAEPAQDVVTGQLLGFLNTSCAMARRPRAASWSLEGRPSTGAAPLISSG